MVMPAAKFSKDFQDWVDDYEKAGNIVQKENRIYRINNDIILIMFSLRIHTSNGTLLVSTDENNKEQLKATITEAKQKNLKFFCCAIYDKEKTVKYLAMQDYIMSIECFDYFLKNGQGTMTITKYYDEIAANKKDIFRINYNGTSVAFVKKDVFAKYLEYFDNRPYSCEGAYKADKIEYRDGKWLENKVLKETQYPHNLLIHGAPGTGKSSMIRKYFADNNVDQNHFERVTFYEDYSYGSFVGTYKPVMDVVSKKLVISSPTEGYNGEINGRQIIYEFVPGPFSRVLLKAYLQIITKDKDIENFYLIIEEINRAKAASVFGDMFQLLDRKKGESIYEITPSAEFLRWFVESIRSIIGQDFNIKSLKLPPNLYIWATMNSADQGVFPLDTAFKRRWGYIYKDVNAKSNKIIRLSGENGANDYNWDSFRQGINNLISKFFDEDKCIGPGYFSDEELEYIKKYTDAVIASDDLTYINNPLVDKLLSYLRQDVFRNNPKVFFNEDFISMSAIREAVKLGKKLTDITKLTSNDFVDAKISID